MGSRRRRVRGDREIWAAKTASGARHVPALPPCARSDGSAIAVAAKELAAAAPQLKQLYSGELLVWGARLAAKTWRKAIYNAIC